MKHISSITKNNWGKMGKVKSRSTESPSKHTRRAVLSWARGRQPLRFQRCLADQVLLCGH